MTSNTEPADCSFWRPCAYKPVFRSERAQHGKKPMHLNQSQPLLAATRESPWKAEEKKIQLSQKVKKKRKEKIKKSRVDGYAWTWPMAWV